MGIILNEKPNFGSDDPKLLTLEKRIETIGCILTVDRKDLNLTEHERRILGMN